MDDRPDPPPDTLAAAQQELARCKADYERRRAEWEAAAREQDERHQALLFMLEDLKRSQHQIEHARGELTAVFDAIRDPLFLHDREFRIVRANRAYATRAGLPVQAIVGRVYWEVFPRNTGPLSSCARALQEEEEEEEEEVNLPSGEVFVSRSFPLRGPQGAYLYSVHILEDVTERQLAKAALRQSEERYRLLFDTMLNGFALHEVVLDAEGRPCDYRFLEANPAFERLTGLKAAEIIGKTVLEVLPQTEPVWIEHYGKVALTGEPARFEQFSGTIGRYFSVLAYRTEANRFAVVFEDITERRQAEQALRRTNRALKTLSTCNGVLVRATEEPQLLREMCRAVVETGGYRLAWVGFAQQDAAKSVAVAAQAGAAPGYLESLGFTWADTEKGQNTAGRAIRAGEPVVSQNILADPAMALWRAVARTLGCGASISLPLKQEGRQVFGVLVLDAAEPDAFDVEETQLLTELADDLAYGILALRTRAERDRIAHAHAHHAEILRQSLEQSIAAIALTVEKRDPYTAGHQQRVAQLCVALGRELGWEAERIEGLRLGALIHDIGKIYVPAEILNRPGRLTEAEFAIIKSHPEVGYDIVKDVEFPWPVAETIRQHHERLDGSGYPRGLKGEEIILEARILAVADTVEAMSSHRPYRPARGIEKALAEIERHRGDWYDPAAADACLKLFREKRFGFVV